MGSVYFSIYIDETIKTKFIYVIYDLPDQIIFIQTNNCGCVFVCLRLATTGWNPPSQQFIFLERPQTREQPVCNPGDDYLYTSARPLSLCLFVCWSLLLVSFYVHSLGSGSVYAFQTRCMGLRTIKWRSLPEALFMKIWLLLRSWSISFSFGNINLISLRKKSFHQFRCGNLRYLRIKLVTFRTSCVWDPWVSHTQKKRKTSKKIISIRSSYNYFILKE